MKVCVVPWEVARGILVGVGMVVHGSMVHSHGHISSATRSWAHVPMIQAGLSIMLLLLQMMIMLMWMEWSVVMLTVSSSTAVGIVHRLVVIIIDTHCGTGLIRI